MIAIRARNAHQALPELMRQLKILGTDLPEKDGPLLGFEEPVSITLEFPWERLTFWEEVNLNPFLMLAEAMWMLAGHKDVAFLAKIDPRTAIKSQDGVTHFDAYGHRWINHFKFSYEPNPVDQIQTIANRLKEYPTHGVQVLSIWDGHFDFFESDTCPTPEDTHIYFSRLNAHRKLDMMICSRQSNIIDDMLGHSAVHFSLLQELLSGFIGCEVGGYSQVAMTGFINRDDQGHIMENLAENAFPCEKYYVSDLHHLSHIPLLPRGSAGRFLGDLKMYMDEGMVMGIQDPFVRKVVHPMMEAYHVYSHMDGIAKFDKTIEFLNHTLIAEYCEWKLRAIGWLNIKHSQFLVKHHKEI